MNHIGYRFSYSVLFLRKSTSLIPEFGFDLDYFLPILAALLPEGSPIGDPGPQWGPFGFFGSPLGPHFVSKVPISVRSCNCFLTLPRSLYFLVIWLVLAMLNVKCLDYYYLNYEDHKHDKSTIQPPILNVAHGCRLSEKYVNGSDGR